MATIELHNIVKVYGDGFAAVDDVSIDIEDGEFVILVGPSGSGKSTLLRMIAGLEDITSGDLLIDGTRVNEKAPRDRGLAMVFQNYALYPHLTVYENIAFPLRLSKHKVKEKELDEAVRNAAGLLELEEHLERKPANLSGGQRQRVAMGRALVREANAFLFDEPLSNLDAKLRGQMRTEIARLQRRLGTTTVYVTHDQTEAMTLGDRVAVLRRGVMQQIASPRELYEQPVNLFVAGFIGSPPMNFVPGRVEGSTLHLPFGDVPLPEAMVEQAGGREVVVAGIRPEHFEDASIVDTPDDGVTFDAEVDVTEWLGDQLYAYVPFEAEGDVRRKLDELDRELDGEGMRTQLVVALDGQSKVRDGSRATLWLDTRRMHLFDPETGDNLTRDEEEATRLGRESADARKEAIERERRRRDGDADGAGEGTRTVDVRDKEGARA
ncbi:ABC transporter ATP-binding protein [Aquipuribacter sp. SD81]|uniref:ABC transporter ATP-binding protein n=1 Tax=Aquipuribacter sp. SD81 TaxID=3127703 RepID=UPI0030196C63